ncbi:MAG: fumarylacetoacetate hydrolase family protein [Caldilineaceae bacterium]|nr:fumarylacetoacetate hydrolase family protein [Caldilineaceae bacterium]
MRIVRFTEAFEGLPASWSVSRWGMLVDQVVYPLAQAPYLDPLDEGLYAPIIESSPLALDDVVLLAPVRPTKIVCVGRNYAAHAAELGNEVPTEPLIFLKPPSSVIGPDADVVYPEISTRVDHEGELAVIIGRRCRYLREDDAMDVIFGYSVANDVTARDLQKQDGQWTRGKGFDTFAPIGPWIDTEFDPANRDLLVTVNGEVRQRSNTDLMIYPIPRILSFVTRFLTLEPGDVILTGTPEGVGPVQPGDVMTVEIDGLGGISNPVITEEEARRRGDADYSA